jgi:hypothetical protein
VRRGPLPERGGRRFSPTSGLSLTSSQARLVWVGRGAQAKRDRADDNMMMISVGARLQQANIRSRQVSPAR